MVAEIVEIFGGLGSVDWVSCLISLIFHMSYDRTIKAIDALGLLYLVKFRILTCEQESFPT